MTTIALIHEQLHKYDYAGTVALDRYLIDLCQGIASASSSSEQTWTIIVDADPLIISTDIAVPLGLIVNELVTKAIQHSRPAGEGGNVQIMLKADVGNFLMSAFRPGQWSGGGSDWRSPHAGLGARIVPNQCYGYKRLFGGRLYRYDSGCSQRGLIRGIRVGEG